MSNISEIFYLSYFHDQIFSVAFLNFGLETPQGLCLTTGILLGVFGAMQIAVYLKNPELYNYP